MPAPLAAALPEFARIGSDCFAATIRRPTHARAVQSVGQAGALPDADAREAWCALADWLLTQDGDVSRKRHVQAWISTAAAPVQALRSVRDTRRTSCDGSRRGGRTGARRRRGIACGRCRRRVSATKHGRSSLPTMNVLRHARRRA